MKASLALLLIAVTAVAAHTPIPTDMDWLTAHNLEEVPAVHDALIDHVNNVGAKWTAGRNERFEGATLADVKNLCGTIIDGPGKITLPEKEADWKLNLVADSIPSDFDARTNWKECPIIGHIRDQANCGSCWAFGSTEAFNDRLCIASGGKFQKELSAQHTTSCCNFLECMSMGCNGGQPGMAWRWFVKKGVVTGGDYEDISKGDTCWPYQLPTCSHHVSSKYPNCTAEVSAPSCRTSCSESKYSSPFAQDKVHAKSSYSVSGVEKIQQEIMTYGPVTGAFTVYADFPTYKSGVYHHVTGSQLGGHAIRIFGWGVEDGTPYWLVANSWNETWGDNGTFKIKRGNNECGIEGNISAGHA